MTNVTIGRSLKSPPHWLLSRFALSFSFFFSFRMIYTDTVLMYLMYLMCSSAPSASVICHHQLWSLSHQPSTYLVLFLLLLRTFRWQLCYSLFIDPQFTAILSWHFSLRNFSWHIFSLPHLSLAQYCAVHWWAIKVVFPSTSSWAFGKCF